MSPHGHLHTQHKTEQGGRLGDTEGWGPLRRPITNPLPLEAPGGGGISPHTPPSNTQPTPLVSHRPQCKVGGNEYVRVHKMEAKAG